MKKIITLCLSLCMTAALAAPAYALEYSIDAPNDYDFGKDTSIEVIHTADGGAMRNEDVSKNAALIPPVFGSERIPDAESCAAHPSHGWRRDQRQRRCGYPREYGEQRQRLSALCAVHGGDE